MEGKRQKIGWIAIAIAIIAFGTQIVTATIQGVATIPVPEMIWSLALTLLQAQGTVPDALPLPVETAPGVFNAVKGLLSSHGVPQPVPIVGALIGSAVGVVFKRRQGS